MKDYNKLINKLIRISEDMHWELLTEAAMAIRELQVERKPYALEIYNADSDSCELIYAKVAEGKYGLSVTRQLYAMKGTE